MREFGYKKSGNQIALLERYVSAETGDLVYYTNEWKSPESDLDSGLLVEYSGTITAPTAETSDVDVSRNIALAIVDYVKHRMLKDENNEKLANYYYNQFLIKIRRDNSVRSGSPGITIPSGTGVLK